MVLLDARTAKWDDGRRIPGAQSLPADSSLELYESVVPEKNTYVVVYCGGAPCPAAKILIENMIACGYYNISEYEGGIKEWAFVKKFPVIDSRNIA